MKKNLLSSAVISLGLIVAVGLPVATAAENAATTNSTNGASADLSAEKAAAAKERLEKKKAELKTALNVADEAKYKARCQNAQKVLGSHSDRVGSRVKIRGASYDALVDRLENLVGRLKAKSADTTTLESQIAVLKTKIETFETDLAAYQAALSDAKIFDCGSDPTAFKAGLDAARTLRDKLLTDASDIKTYVKDTIKPTLATIRADFEAAAGSQQ